MCSKCLQLNPHAIWLVKFKCFKRSSHRYVEEVIVVIEPNSMKLIEVRPLPENYDTFRGKFWMCRDVVKHGVCDKSHAYAHSEVEYDSWNAKKTILQGSISIFHTALIKFNITLFFVECPDVVSELQECEMSSVSPSLVCVKCWGENHEATWLSYMTCLKPNEHHGASNVTVLVDDDELVTVRSGSHLSGVDVSEIMLCDYTPNCFRKQKCKFAHSQIELNYWRWQRAKEIFCSEISEMVSKKLQLDSMFVCYYSGVTYAVISIFPMIRLMEVILKSCVIIIPTLLRTVMSS